MTPFFRPLWGDTSAAPAPGLAPSPGRCWWPAATRAPSLRFPGPAYDVRPGGSRVGRCGAAYCRGRGPVVLCAAPNLAFWVHPMRGAGVAKERGGILGRLGRRSRSAQNPSPAAAKSLKATAGTAATKTSLKTAVAAGTKKAAAAKPTKAGGAAASKASVKKAQATTKKAPAKATASKRPAKVAAVSKAPSKAKAPAKRPAKAAGASKAPANPAKVAATKRPAKASGASKAPARKAAPASKAPANTGPAKASAASKRPGKAGGQAVVRKAPAKGSATSTISTGKAAAARPPRGGASTQEGIGSGARVRVGLLPALPGDRAWTAQEVSGVRASLTAEAIDLRHEIDDASAAYDKALREGDQGTGDDQADAGSATFEREHELSLAANSRDLLAQVERALQRLDAGTYGDCEVCGNPIGKERLKAFPKVTLCLTCKQRENRR